MNCADPIPAFPLPLKSGDLDLFVDIQRLLHQVYDRAAYDLEIDLLPSLAAPDQAWLEQRLIE